MAQDEFKIAILQCSNLLSGRGDTVSENQHSKSIFPTVFDHWHSWQIFNYFSIQASDSEIQETLIDERIKAHVIGRYRLLVFAANLAERSRMTVLLPQDD